MYNYYFLKNNNAIIHYKEVKLKWTTKITDRIKRRITDSLRMITIKTIKIGITATQGKTIRIIDKTKLSCCPVRAAALFFYLIGKVFVKA